METEIIVHNWEMIRRGVQRKLSCMRQKICFCQQEKKDEEEELDKSLCRTAPLQQIEDYYDSSSYFMFLLAFIPRSFFF